LAVDSEKLDLEIAALRLVFLNDREFRPPGRHQAAALASLMNSGLSDRRGALRLEVLREITGLPQLESSTQLTAHMVSVLIGYLKQEEVWELNEDGREFMQALKLTLFFNTYATYKNCVSDIHFYYFKWSGIISRS
jgi:hypothetical protein